MSVNRAHLMHPHGREADSSGSAARREERDAVVPVERQATPQRARRVASRMGFGAMHRNVAHEGL